MDAHSVNHKSVATSRFLLTIKWKTLRYDQKLKIKRFFTIKTACEVDAFTFETLIAHKMKSKQLNARSFGFVLL